MAVFLAAAEWDWIAWGEDVWSASTCAIFLPPHWCLPALGHQQKTDWSLLWDVKPLGTDGFWLSIHDVLRDWVAASSFCDSVFLSVKWGSFIHATVSY